MNLALELIQVVEEVFGNFCLNIEKIGQLS